jgi:hypothetical protein
MVGPAPDQAFDLVGPGVGGEVDVAFLVRAQVEQGVADAPADEEALVPGRDEPPRQLLDGCVRVEEGPQARRDGRHGLILATIHHSTRRVLYVHVMRGCGRPECNEPAAAAIGFDNSRRAVWLHPLDEPEATGRLCQRHADSLRVPQGWRFFDYRQPEAAAEAPKRRNRTALGILRRESAGPNSDSASTPVMWTARCVCAQVGAVRSP